MNSFQRTEADREGGHRNSKPRLSHLTSLAHLHAMTDSCIGSTQEIGQPVPVFTVSKPQCLIEWQ